jgi:hypothetical protein
MRLANCRSASGGIASSSLATRNQHGRGRRPVNAPPRGCPWPGPDDPLPAAPGKAALLDGVVETVLAQLHVDPADPTGPPSCAHALAVYDGAAELERGLDIPLTGLAATLSPLGNLRSAPGARRRA